MQCALGVGERKAHVCLDSGYEVQFAWLMVQAKRGWPAGGIAEKRDGVAQLAANVTWESHRRSMIAPAGPQGIVVQEIVQNKELSVRSRHPADSE